VRGHAARSEELRALRQRLRVGNLLRRHLRAPMIAC
jgi:hypothetical protein